MELAFAIDLSPFALGSVANNRLKISCALLNRMGKLYDAGASPEGKGGEMSRIRVTWEADEAEGSGQHCRDVL